MSTFNNDELEPPKWMDKEFILTILKNCEADEPIEITDLKFTPGTEKGDHYASIMFRAVAKFTTANGSSTRSMIIKTLPELDSFKGEMLAQTKVFETEIGIYSEIIPKFEAELRKFGDETQLGAKALYCTLTPRKVIVFEDLCTLGYNTVRGRFLNMIETKKMLLYLAKWHAVGYKLALENDTRVKAYDQGIFNSPLAETSPFLNGGMKLLADLVSTLEGYEFYADKIKAIETNLLKNCVKTFNAYQNGDKQSILVLNHGDFHMKNAMFKLKEETLDDILLVDFQLCSYAPAIIDVIYSIYMLMNPELRLNHREELIHYYFENFLSTLKKIEFKGVPPTLADFNIDMIRHRDFEIFVFANFLPMWFTLMEPMEAIEADQILQSSNHRAILYRHPKYVKEVKEFLPKLLYKGYLDSIIQDVEPSQDSEAKDIKTRQNGETVDVSPIQNGGPKEELQQRDEPQDQTPSQSNETQVIQSTQNGLPQDEEPVQNGIPQDIKSSEVSNPQEIKLSQDSVQQAIRSANFHKLISSST